MKLGLWELGAMHDGICDMGIWDTWTLGLAWSDLGTLVRTSVVRFLWAGYILSSATGVSKYRGNLFGFAAFTLIPARVKEDGVL